MAEHRFSAGIAIARPPQAVFDWVADYRHVAEVLEGVDRWEPLQQQTRGLGARFDVSISVLGFPLENVLVLDRWEEPRCIGWRSEGGLIRQTGRWDFRPCTEGTMVSLSIGYLPPLGLVGQLVAGEVDSLVRGRLRQALEGMKRSVLLQGLLEVFDPRSFQGPLRAVLEGPTFALSLAGYALKNAPFVAGYLLDLASIPRAWWPQNRVVLRLRATRARQLPALDV